MYPPSNFHGGKYAGHFEGFKVGVGMVSRLELECKYFKFSPPHVWLNCFHFSDSFIASLTLPTLQTTDHPQTSQKKNKHVWFDEQVICHHWAGKTTTSGSFDEFADPKLPMLLSNLSFTHTGHYCIWHQPEQVALFFEGSPSNLPYILAFSFDPKSTQKMVSISWPPIKSNCQSGRLLPQNRPPLQGSAHSGTLLEVPAPLERTTERVASWFVGFLRVPGCSRGGVTGEP